MRDWTIKEFVLAVFAGLVVVSVVGILAFVSIRNHEIDAQINAQTEVEKTEIEQAAKLKRTQERMNAVPWYKGGENKEGE